MQGLLIAIDKVNTWVGKIFSWSIVAMTLAMQATAGVKAPTRNAR